MKKLKLRSCFDCSSKWFWLIEIKSFGELPKRHERAMI